MEIIEGLVIGSPEWIAYNSASEAPAMMGVSKYQSRDELLHLKHIGEKPEVASYQQKIFDKGHAAEAAARPHIEAMIGEDLYPATGLEKFGEISLLASFDGLTMGQDIVFEHKLWNDGLASLTKTGDLPKHYLCQLEQQLMVSGAEKAIFVVSDGTPDKMVHCGYTSDPELRKAILAGWAQFEKDLDSFAPEAVAEKPQAQALMELPALNIQIFGEVKETNLALYEESALAFISKINTDLQTDQDFADAEQTVKFCGEAEKKLALVKEQALSQTADIDALFKSVDKMSEEFRRKRLELDKLVKNQKEVLKAGIITEGQAALEAYINEHNQNFNRPYITFTADFRGAIKGKRTITSIRSAVNDTLAAAKIEISEMALKITANVKTLTELAGDHKSLFPDLQQIIFKESDDFTLLVKSRITDQEAAEKVRAEEKEKQAKEATEAEQAAQEQCEAPTPQYKPKEAQSQNYQPKQPAIDYQKEITKSLIQGGIGKTTALKVAKLIIAGQVKMVRLHETA